MSAGTNTVILLGAMVEQLKDIAEAVAQIAINTTPEEEPEPEPGDENGELDN